MRFRSRTTTAATTSHGPTVPVYRLSAPTEDRSYGQDLSVLGRGNSRCGIAADVDPPAGQPRRQPGILPFLADRQGQLKVRNDDPGGLRGCVDDGDRERAGRGQRIADESGRIVVVID